jgi:hypothetical protein
MSGVRGIPVLALAALISGLASAALAAELVVVEARGLSLKQGEVIDDAKPIMLKDGQLLTLVAENGTILTLRGPYDQAPAGGSGGVDVASALGALTTKNAQRNVAGVIRAAAEDVHLPSPWLVDVSHAGTACLRGNERPVFWRGSDAGGTLTLMPADRSWRGQAQWPSGSPTLAAPSNFPLKDGRTYLADFGSKPVAVTLAQLPPAVTNARMQAAWMLEKGCVAQAEALLKTIQ